MDRLHRRDALRVMGVGAASLGSATAAHASPTEATPAPHAEATEATATASDSGDARTAVASTEPPWRLLAPLSVGSMLGSVRLTDLSAVTATGTVDVEFETADFTLFRVRLCRRDPAPDAPQPIAHTRHFDLFLANHGRGDKATDEEQGVTVLALAAVVKQNEQAHPAIAVGTLRQRWQRLAQGAT